MKLFYSPLVLILVLFVFAGCDKQPAQKTHSPMTSQNAMASNPCNPCEMNPCAMNPCSLEAKGKALWSDASLGTSGMSCTNCHAGGKQLKLNLSFPHFVKMPNKSVTLPQMINYCITTPLKGEAIAENSMKMKAMVAYYNYMAKHRVKDHGAMNACNPCMMHKNPCSLKKNPCGM